MASVQKRESGIYHVVFYFRGRQIWRSLYTRDVRKAKRRARVERENYIETYYQNLAGGQCKKVEEAATIGDVVAAYRAWPKKCKTKTENNQIRALLRIVREACGVEDAEEVSTSALTRSLVWGWMAKRQGLEQIDRQEALAENVTINSTYSQAKGVFAKGYREEGCFEGLTLPDLGPFLSVQSLPEIGDGWKPWSPEDWHSMVKASEALEGDLWLVHQMLRRFGLRAGELKVARGDWLRFEGGRWLLWIDRGKTQERRLEIPSDLLEPLLARREEEFLIPGRRVKKGEDGIRVEVIDGEHVRFVRQFCDRAHPNHELRRWAGSIVYTRDCAEAARKFLGHTSIRTTEQWYAHYLDQVEPIGLEDEQLANVA